MDRAREKKGRLHPWARAACMAEFLHCASQRRSIRESRSGRWSSRKQWKQRVVHRQELSPGKLIPKHKSQRLPLLFPPKDWSGFIYSSFSALHRYLQPFLKREKTKHRKSKAKVNQVYRWLIIFDIHPHLCKFSVWAFQGGLVEIKQDWN